MADTQNIQEIQSSKGGNRIALVLLSSSYAIPGTLTADSNCIDIGHLKESKTAIISSVDKKKNEAKEVVATEMEYEGSTTAITMQTSKRIIDFLAFTVRDGLFLLYRKAGINNGKTQEYFAIGRTNGQMNHQNPGASENMNFEYTHLVSETARTFTSANINSIETALGFTIATTLDVTIPAGQEFVLVETS